MSSPSTDTTNWIDYDYAIVRVAPRVELSTFANIGVVIHSRTSGYLDARFGYDRERLAILWPELDLDLLDRYIDAYVRVCRGEPNAGPIALLPPSERFHWLTAPRSAVLQTSAVHPGRCRDPKQALEDLFNEQCQ